MILEDNSMTNNTINVSTRDTVDVKKYFIRFDSIENANKWLISQDSIVITSMAVSTATEFSFPANNIAITEVRIEYIQYPHRVNHCYGISEISHSSLYVSAKIESLRNKWIQNNPDKKYVYCVKSTTRRHLMGTGFGFISFVKDKLVVLFKY